ncbi:hypothetical protein [Arthrobacter sp. ES1]|uniref:hypothetical protein n=1 Tax=Arthrobacter sp. ES1 TaxID=1897056 RepID=UPI001CFFF187|nr:hypothetical protein [Arthrobacter sp. ES1]MCB5281120.1 hypothetical protein [Arthrobacter sp. ES1]
MTQILMAVALFILAAARVPSLRRNGKDTVFMAAVFAGASSLLISPPVYLAVDPALGGINITKLALNSFMIVGLWYLRTAVLHAVNPEADTRSPLLRRLPLIVALVFQGIFFVLTGPTTSTTEWGNQYHDRLPGALFSMTSIVFIAWSCGEIAWTCSRYVPRMRRAFKIGFTMVGAGAAISCLVMLKMAQEALTSFVPALLIFGDNSYFGPFEMIAIVLVGVGLTIPALAGRAERRQAAARLERTMAKVSAIRDKALHGTDMDRVLQINDDATPQERLHRMIVEIWDAELVADAAGSGRSGQSGLTREDRDYMLLVESDFDLSRTR